MRALRIPAALLALLGMAAGMLTACGSGSAPRSSTLPTATLMLDFTPNAVHTGIYAALAHHWDEAAGVRLHVVAPSSSTDPIKLLEDGRVNFAILDIHDLAIARARGQDIVGIFAIVERPLASVIAQPQIRSPRDLAGKLVGITGAPSDTAVLDSIVAGAGGDIHRLHTITIGFNAVPDLLAGRVAAATAFWNDEGVALRRKRPGFHIFRVDDYGAPRYPELVLCTTRATLRLVPDLPKKVTNALVRGYEFTLRHPAAAAAELEDQVQGLDPHVVSAELAALEPAFRDRNGVGSLAAGVLRRWGRWEARFGIVPRPPNVSQMFELHTLSRY